MSRPQKRTTLTVALHTVPVKESRMSWRNHKYHRLAKVALAFGNYEVISSLAPPPVAMRLSRYLKPLATSKQSRLSK